MIKAYCDVCGGELNDKEAKEAEIDDYGHSLPQLTITLVGLGYKEFDHVCCACRDELKFLLNIKKK